MAGRSDRRSLRVLPLAALLAAGCQGEKSVGPAITTDVALGSGQYALFAGDQAAGTLRFPAAGATGVTYLIVGQFAGPDTVSASADFSGTNVMPVPGAPAAVPPLQGAPPAETSPALQFHDAIRRLEAAAARASLGMPATAPRAPAAAPPPLPAPPAVGSLRTFRVCANLACSSLVDATARVQVVGTHSAIYVDTLAPANGFTLSDLQQLDAQFDTVLYPIDHAAFGAESDIDGNGVVLILLTPKVNALVSKTQCFASFVTGFFFGADLAPATRSQYNDGEIFYGMVPDPSGTVSCAYTAAKVAQVIAPTFIHEFQHMISFNQHVLARGGGTEEVWLNEAMSHLAEELGGRHYDSIGTASADTIASQFLIGDVYNAYLYLAHPAGVPVVMLDGLDSLDQRGAQWLFLRFLVDRFGPTITQQLEQTAQLGAANIATATGTPFATLLGRWALALYVSDLPGFTPDSALTYRHWAFRTTYASLNKQNPGLYPSPFPLEPTASPGGAFFLTGRLATGSGSYVLVTQAAGAGPFSVTLRDANGAALPGRAGAQVAAVRIQ